MTKLPLFTVAALLAVAPAFAQTSTTTSPAQTAPPVVQGGSPAAANSGPGAVGTATPGGSPAEQRSNNSAASGNAEQPTRPVPQTGKGGGAGSGG